MQSKGVHMDADQFRAAWRARLIDGVTSPEELYHRYLCAWNEYANKVDRPTMTFKEYVGTLSKGQQKEAVELWRKYGDTNELQRNDGVVPGDEPVR